MRNGQTERAKVETGSRIPDRGVQGRSMQAGVLESCAGSLARSLSSGEEHMTDIGPVQRRRACFLPTNGESGFTLIMLLITISVITILAAIAMPRGDEITRIKVNASARRVGGDLRYVQDLAMKTGELHTVSFTTEGYRVTGSGGQVVEDPSLRGGPFVIDINSEFPGVRLETSFQGGSVSYDWRGRPSSGGSITLSLGQSSTVLRVESETGHVSF